MSLLNKMSLRILAVIAVLSLLLVALPAPSVLAAEDIELDPDEGKVGDYFYVTGDGFEPSDETEVPPVVSEVDIYFSSQEADVGDDIDDEVANYEELKAAYDVDEDGEFNVKVTVPSRLTDGEDDEDVVRGTYYVYVTYEGDENIEAVAEFTVIGAVITLAPEQGQVGTKVKITGQDFAESEAITVKYSDVSVPIDSGATKTDSNGKFTCTIVIPDSVAGEHTITVLDKSDNESEAVFTVEPGMTIGSTSGIVGDNVTISGIGFGYQSDVTVSFGSTNVATIKTTKNGNFSVTFPVPVMAPAAYTVKVEDGEGNKGEARFTIAANVSLSKATGNVGDKVTINGTGFKAQSNVTITYTAEPVTVANATTDAKGAFSFIFTIPVSKKGAHNITISDGVTTLSQAFTMESTAPPIPQPSAPADGLKVKQPVQFDWQDVTDPSGVTYTLQIASDADFKSIVLEKKELTKSEYTLTEAEKLKSTKEEAPYHWRIKATDGAGNESAWTGSGKFNVGSTFDLSGITDMLSGWVLIVVLALGVLLIFFFGFLVGRRGGGGGGDF